MAYEKTIGEIFLKTFKKLLTITLRHSIYSLSREAI